MLVSAPGGEAVQLHGELDGQQGVVLQLQGAGLGHWGSWAGQLGSRPLPPGLSPLLLRQAQASLQLNQHPTPVLSCLPLFPGECCIPTCCIPWNRALGSAVRTWTKLSKEAGVPFATSAQGHLRCRGAEKARPVCLRGGRSPLGPLRGMAYIPCRGPGAERWEQ